MRRLWYDLDNAEWLRDSLGLFGCQIVIRLEFLRRTSGGEILFRERRYYVTSLDPGAVSARDLPRLIRGHWQVENRLHFVKDRWWDEDRHYLKRPGLGAVFASLTNAAISVLRFLPDSEPILRARTEKIQWPPAAALPPSDSNNQLCKPPGAMSVELQGLISVKSEGLEGFSGGIVKILGGFRQRIARFLDET